MTTSWKDDLNWGLAAFGLKLPDSLPLDRWVSTLADSPARNAALLVGLSTLIFYAAEREHNPKVNDLFDAMLYTSTCLSVGYAEIHPQTPTGKVLGSLLMTVGPALATKQLDGPALERRDAVQIEVLATLKQILAEMRATPAHAPATASAPEQP